jgi:hypothetical protein
MRSLYSLYSAYAVINSVSTSTKVAWRNQQLWLQASALSRTVARIIHNNWINRSNAVTTTAAGPGYQRMLLVVARYEVVVSFRGGGRFHGLNTMFRFSRHGLYHCRPFKELLFLGRNRCNSKASGVLGVSCGIVVGEMVTAAVVVHP